MPTHNSENPAKGKRFQIACSTALSSYLGVNFDLEKPLPIGNPPKHHKFDLVSSDGSHVAECKCYTWTETGNMPSAKMGFVNEAVFYLTFLSGKKRFIVMLRDLHPKRNESLAEYYYRTYKHLLGGVVVLELDDSTGKITEVR